jgi:glutaminase
MINHPGITAGTRRAAIGGAMLSAFLSVGLPAQSPTEIRSAVQAAYDKYKDLEEGKNADYIPALAKVDPKLFGIVLITPDGKVYTAGNITQEVSIQSISKVFTLAKVLEDSGETAVLNRIGVDATGRPFNSAFPTEENKGKRINPFVNAGAIATTAMVSGSATEIWQKIANTYNAFAGRQLQVLEDVYQSEAASNEHNKGLAALQWSWGTIKENPNQAVDIYTRQCSVGVNAKDLAEMAATLANQGRNPVTDKQVLAPQHVAPLLAVMATAGLYETTGQWLYATGLPAKSGVGGGLIAVAPGRFGIAVISPPLDGAGNSVRAQRAIADISTALGANPYAAVAHHATTR